MITSEKEFLAMIRQQKDQILRICHNYGSEKLTADDLFQEVMYNLWKSMDSFRGESSRETWVYRVTLYTCMQHYRKSRRHQEVMAKIPAPDLPENAEHDERLNRLHLAVGALDEPDRAIMILYLEEHSYAEIAEIMGISVSNTGVRIARARKKIKRLMESYGN